MKTKLKVFSRKLMSFIKHPFIRKNEPMLHTVEWIFVLLAFFSIGLSVAFFQVSTNFLGDWWEKYTGIKISKQVPEEEKQFVGETISEPIDTTGWDTYRNRWYGFEIKHPDSWTNTQFKAAYSKNARYEIVYKFRKDSGGENDPYVGFDVAVYPTRKAANPESTNEMRKVENAPEDTTACQSSEEVTLGGENNKFQKVSVKKDNACFEPVYFFSIAKGNYLYDIVPVAKEGADPPANIEQDVNKNFPEYKEAVASFTNISVSRPLAVPSVASKPRPTHKACHLSGGKISGGRIVCAKKNDHPSRSKTKGHHMDEDCCMDPDESRNPCCSY